MTSPPPDIPTRTLRLRADLAYDGREFHGWATQPGLRTIQGEVEGAIARVLRLDTPPRTTVAGRTDAGVHARGQVAHVDVPVTSWRHVASVGRGTAVAPAERVAGRVNGVLAHDVRVLHLAPAPAGFDARFSATARRYCYRIADNPRGRHPLDRGSVLWHGRHLDTDLMMVAAVHLVGEHDFAALSRLRVGASTVRRVIEATVGRTPAGTIELWIEADAFCHSMVRSIAGALVAVGESRRDPTWIAELLTRTGRDSAATVLAPHGLTLEVVRYPPDADLAAAAQAHRVVRGPLH